MQLSTPVALPEKPFSLDTASRVVLLGSCFSEGVGERLHAMMGEESVLVNPFGVLYNPVSIANALEMLMDPNAEADRYTFEGRDGRWHSWMHTSHFSAATEAECRQKTILSHRQASQFLRHATLLIVTFGTTRCYRLADNDLVVANCHKEPQAVFIEQEPSLAELTALWRKTLNVLHAFNPSLKVIFTVSPYRYRKYGFHASQLQKARLLLLVDELMNAVSPADAPAGCTAEDPAIAYFPSYEILLDELRDYRFYATDMLHPSDLAVDIITERFTQWLFTPELLALSAENVKRKKREAHRTLI